MRNSWILSGLLLALVAVPAAANPNSDDAWLAWAGCWRAEGDVGVRALCIVPDGAGIRMLTMKGNEVESETRLVADGQPHALSQEGCTGTETARWSEDGKRLFIDADLTCGSETKRQVSSIWAMLNGSQWVNVQSVGFGDERMVNTVRYNELELKAAPADITQALEGNRMARETIRLSAASQLDLADVRDAVQQADTRAVEAWLTLVGQEFNLNGEKLVALADAGVPGSVIDILVALSNPNHFAVREARADEVLPARRSRGVSCLDSYWYDPYDPFGYRSARFSRNYYGSSYGCGLRGWGYYPTWGGYWGGGGGIIIIAPSDGIPRERGRVTRSGYRGPRDTGVGSSNTTRTNTSSGSTRSSGDSDASSSSSSSGGGRKAKPRDN